MSDFNLGTVTAYGYAKDKGYTGTEEEFAELMASYASVAESAAASAESAAASATTATTKAGEASTSASNAATSATTASTAATTATTKAGEASTSASTASTKASEATTAAATATTKAGEASTSATNAAGSATTASTAATTATTKASEAAASATAAAQSAASLVIDDTLTHAGQAADAKKTGDEISDLKDGLSDMDDRVTALEEGGSGSGLTDDIKEAMLQIARKVAYIDEDGQTYYDALEDALYPPASLVRITATYTQSGEVYDNQTLDSLRTDLVVSAHMSDSTTQTVTTYTLSGTLVTGTSTITVTYGGKTTTFTVVVTHATTQYTVTNTLANCSNSNFATVVNENSAYSGTLTADTDYVMGTVAITMGGTDVTSTAYNSETGVISIASVTGNIVITATATAPPITVTSGLPLTLAWNSGYTNLTLSEPLGNEGDAYRLELYFTGLVQDASEKLKVQSKGGSADTWLFNNTDSQIAVTEEQVAEQKIVYSGTLSSFNAGATALGVSYKASGVTLTDVKMYKE